MAIGKILANLFPWTQVQVIFSICPSYQNEKKVMQRKKHIFGFVLNIKQHHILVKATLLSEVKLLLSEVKITISIFLLRYVFLKERLLLKTENNT